MNQLVYLRVNDTWEQEKLEQEFTVEKFDGKSYVLYDYVITEDELNRCLLHLQEKYSQFDYKLINE